mmetsp:Transcript_7833/g.19908  ORF Transcript_7833/g.19908 Transcript_7833/m.19908 type:complete len:300 (-) Transcript_7833:1292-2191(-)
MDPCDKWFLACTIATGLWYIKQIFATSASMEYMACGCKNSAVGASCFLGDHALFSKCTFDFSAISPVLPLKSTCLYFTSKTKYWFSGCSGTNFVRIIDSGTPKLINAFLQSSERFLAMPFIQASIGLSLSVDFRPMPSKDPPDEEKLPLELPPMDEPPPLVGEPGVATIWEVKIVRGTCQSLYKAATSRSVSIANFSEENTAIGSSRVCGVFPHTFLSYVISSLHVILPVSALKFNVRGAPRRVSIMSEVGTLSSKVSFGRAIRKPESFTQMPCMSSEKMQPGGDLLASAALAASHASL